MQSVEGAEREHDEIGELMKWKFAMLKEDSDFVRRVKSIWVGNESRLFKSMALDEWVEGSGFTTTNVNYVG